MTAFVYWSGWMYVAHCEQYDLCVQGWTKAQAIDRLVWMIKAYQSLSYEHGRNLLEDLGPSRAVRFPCEIHDLSLVDTATAFGR